MSVPFDNSFAALGSPFSSAQMPIPVADPALIRVNTKLAKQLGIDPLWLGSREGVEVLAGNRVAPGSDPVAAAYAGHQFGHFNPQLGDGRAVLLGEVLDTSGHRYDLQLKGSGRTPWSRGGDGRSPLGPVLREYIVSEAMAALGVPTTRALAAVSTGERVIRDGAQPVFRDQHPRA
ncbi:MAG: protein adenylyltransferase SelO family protein [Congregibacter sp.]|nr:protein adenylyltransferase SelO family protein [Congregibacter sp.]